MFGLDERYVQLLISIFEKYDSIDTVKIFGSRVKETYTDRSDIDLVIFGTSINRFLLSQLQDEILESNIPYKVDIQLYNDIKNKNLIGHINRVGKLFYEKTGK